MHREQMKWAFTDPYRHREKTKLGTKRICTNKGVKVILNL